MSRPIALVFTILYCVCAAMPISAQTQVPEGMVQIPAGKFWMGRNHAVPNDADDNMPRAWRDDRPANNVYLDAFYLDKYEVTNAEYAGFVEATGGKGGKVPWHWLHGKVPAGDEKQAVTNITWFEADAYCKSVGKRLPTEAEWEKAVRGGLDRKIYSWGDAEDVKLAVQRNKAAAVGTSTPNGYGLYDMIGNVTEWTSDWYDRGYYAFMPRENPKGPETGLYRSVRGGSWVEGRGGKLANYYRNFSDPELRSSTIGFRCAR